MVLGGALLAYFGVGELLSAVGVAAEHERPTLSRGRGGAAAVAAGLGVLIGGAAIALAATGPSASRPPALDRLSCNGYAQLCSRRVDEVAFAGTHNAMSAADSPGWLIPNQAHGIARQLDDGLRAFKISTHYALGSKPGHIRTDVTAEGARANRVSEKLTQQARDALQRFSASVGFGPKTGKPSVWLCHTLCELGATSMSSFLGTVAKFLQLNPGQVIVFFDEDYVSEASLQAEFKRAGLFSHLAVLRVGQQMPTLGQLVRSQHNVLVFTQEPVSGHYPWDMNGFSFIQDTPLGAVKPSQFTLRAQPRPAPQPAVDDERLGRRVPAAAQPQPAADQALVHPAPRAPVRVRTPPHPQPDPHRLLQQRRRHRGGAGDQRPRRREARADRACGALRSLS